MGIGITLNVEGVIAAGVAPPWEYEKARMFEPLPDLLSAKIT